MLIAAIDCGLGGALALLFHSGDAASESYHVMDTPTLALTVQRGIKRDYDIQGMYRLLDGLSNAHVFIEEAQAMPGQGVRSMFTTGYGFGLWLGLLSALQLPYTRVRPNVWKKALGLSSDKEAARLRAQQWFPKADLRHKKDHGKAEALLLAWYGRQQMEGQHAPAP